MSNKRTSNQFVATLRDLAALLPRQDGQQGVSISQASALARRFGIGRTARGWNAITLIERIVEARPRVSRLRAEKLKREIRLLDIEIEREESKYVSAEDSAGDIKTICGEVREGLDMWVGWTKAELPEAVYQRALVTRDRINRALAEHDENMQDTIENIGRNQCHVA